MAVAMVVVVGVVIAVVLDGGNVGGRGSSGSGDSG